MSQGVARVPRAEEWILKKRCSLCGETKPWAKFSPRRYWPDGSVRVVSSHCTACKSKLSGPRKAKMREEQPERWARYKASQADWQRRNRRAVAAERAAASHAGPRLPVGPIREFLQQQLDSGRGMAEMADLCDVPERAIYRLLHEHEHVSLHLADTIITRLDGRLYDVYTELGELAA